MSGKKTDNLRNAMKALKVSEPLRLSKSGPSLRAPQNSQNEVPRKEAAHFESSQKEIAQNEPTPVELPQYGVASFEAPQKEQSWQQKGQEIPPTFNLAQSEVAQLELPRNEYPQYEHTHFEQPQKEVDQSGPAQIEAPRKKAPHSGYPQIEIAQDESPQFEVRRKIRGPSPAKASGGGHFFRLSDRAFSTPLLQKLSGDCFRLFLFMSSRSWGYLNSDGTIRASVGFIMEGTGMSHATISRCLKALRDEGLVTLLETNYKRGNDWHVSPIAFSGCDPSDLPPRFFEVPQNENTQSGAVAPSKRGGSSLNLRGKAPQNEVEIRNIKKIQEVSQEGDADPLFDRIAKIRAVEKQKSERECLVQLLKTYSAAEIELAISYLEKNGVLGSNQPCHSPFRYLIVAADDVLKIARRKHPVPAVSVANVDLDLEQIKQRTQAAIVAFESNLSEGEREKFISGYVQREYTWGYVPSQTVLTRLAADRWYSENQKMELRANAS